jgi:hypothetical protein
MARLAATAGPMRIVQCDGFVVYAGRGLQNLQEAAPRRPAPVARASNRAIARRAPVSTGARVARQSPTWSAALRTAVVAAILMGLFGAYSLGRYAATNGPRTGLVYAKPGGVGLAPKSSSGDTVAGRLALRAYR